MAWISKIDDGDWKTSDTLASLYDKVVDQESGAVDNIMSIHSLDAGSMSAHLALYQQAMRGTATLRKVEREMIALLVSRENECHY